MDVKTLGQLPRPNTIQRSVRVPDILWDGTRAKAAREGMTVSEAIRGLLAQWLAEPPAARKPSPGQARRVPQ